MAFSLTISRTAFADLSNTTHWWPPRSRRRTMLAPIRPRPISPSCIGLLLTSPRLGPIRAADRPAGGGRLEQVHESAIMLCNQLDSLLPRRATVPHGDQGLPERGSADCEADESGHLRRRRQPIVHFALVFPAAKHNAADLVAAAGSRRRHHRLAVLAPVQALDLPHIGLHARRLELCDGLRHQAWPDLEVIGLLVTIERVQ